ncbi:hypothetical protein Q3G72_014739 [Acer saccharum]|nr:hypothetical protein Q3G72_014739 [Acer saccharum]
MWSENRDGEDGKQEVVEVLHRKRNDRGQSFKKGINSYYFKLRERKEMVGRVFAIFQTMFGMGLGPIGPSWTANEDRLQGQEEVICLEC